METLVTAGLLAVVVGVAIVLYQQRSPTATLSSGPVNSMHFFSPSEGWVLSSERLLVTRDGGSNWRDVSPGPRMPPMELSEACFLDPRHGWAVTVGGVNLPSDVIRIFRTMDGGNSWASSQMTAEAHFGLSLDFVNPRDGWLIVGETGTIASAGRLFRTADGGATWSELPPPPSGNPVHFINVTTGWNVAGAHLDQLYVSTDGGHEWRQKNVPVPPDYADIAFELAVPTFVDSQLGVLRVMFPDGSVLLEFTTDGGATWSIDSSRAPFFIRRTPAPAGTVDAPAFFGNGVMAVLLGTELHVQSGSGWKSIKPRGLDSVLQIAFLNPRIGWALASSGSCSRPGPYVGCLRVLWTADGGSTWAPIPVR